MDQLRRKGEFMRKASNFETMMKASSMRSFFVFLLCFGFVADCFAQEQLPQIKAGNKNAIIVDGENRQFPWTLDPKAKPDIYYVSYPRRKHEVKFRTDQGEISFKTEYGKTYDFVVLLNGTETCLQRISATEPRSPISLKMDKAYPQTI